MRGDGVLKIAILAHVGNGNLGDEAIVAAVIANLRARLPHTELIGFTLRPADTSSRHGIQAFPIRRGYAATHPWNPVPPANRECQTDRKEPAPPPWTSALQHVMRRLRAIPPLAAAARRLRNLAFVFKEVLLELPFLVQSYGRLSEVSLLIVAGSQQLSDVKGGTWWCPFTVFKWSLLARLRGIPVALASVGAGPFESRLTRWFVGRTVAMASYSSYRDEFSRACIRSLGRKPGPLVPDLAFSLRFDENGEGPAEPVIALNPMPSFIWRDYDERTWRALQARYSDTLCAFAAWLLDRGYRVAFFGTQLRGDPPVAREILARLAASRPAAVVEGRAYLHPVGNFDDLRSILTAAQIVVATRFHGVVLGCSAARPVLALAYHPKTRDVMRQIGDPDCVIDAQTASLEALQSLFLSVERRAADIRARRPSHLAAFRAALAAQYDHIVALALHHPGTAAEATPASLT